MTDEMEILAGGAVLDKTQGLAGPDIVPSAKHEGA
jgi:hypothetical protein